MTVGAIAPLFMKNVGNDVNTKLLVHCDGANASTTFSDSSVGGHSVTATNATVATAASKFGGASGSFNGTTAYLTIGNTLSDFGTGTGDFTVDCWIKTTDRTADNGRLRTIWSTGDVGITVGAYSITINQTTGFLEFGRCATGPAYTTTISSTSAIDDGNWHHIALTRASNIFRIFFDGSLQATSGTITDSFVTPGAGLALIGAGTNPTAGNAGRWNGNIDEFRFSNVARWTATFIAPGVPYS